MASLNDEVPMSTALSVRDKTSPLHRGEPLLKRVCPCLCQHGEILTSIIRITLAWLVLKEQKRNLVDLVGRQGTGIVNVAFGVNAGTERALACDLGPRSTFS